jgi:hypothetical protein
MIETNKDLDKLFRATTFAKADELPIWDGIDFDDPISEEDAPPLGKYVHVPQGSHLGETLITLDDDYEGSGEDCLFIQSLLKLAMRGRLKVIE